MKAIALIFIAVIVAGFSKEEVFGQSMAVSKMKKTKTFEDVMPQIPTGWSIDSFRVCFVTKRGDWACNVNIGEDFDEETTRYVTHAQTGNTYIFGDPVYADSFGIKVITYRFSKGYNIKPDK